MYLRSCLKIPRGRRPTVTPNSAVSLVLRAHQRFKDGF